MSHLIDIELVLPPRQLSVTGGELADEVMATADSTHTDKQAGTKWFLHKSFFSSELQSYIFFSFLITVKYGIVPINLQIRPICPCSISFVAHCVKTPQALHHQVCLTDCKQDVSLPSNTRDQCLKV